MMDEVNGGVRGAWKIRSQHDKKEREREREGDGERGNKK